MPDDTKTATAVSHRAGSDPPGTSLSVVRAAGWSHYTDDLGNHAYVSPDGLLTVEYCPESNRYRSRGILWVITHRDADPYAKPRRDWFAHFGTATPVEAVAAFLSTLLDSAGADPDRA